MLYSQMVRVNVVLKICLWYNSLRVHAYIEGVSMASYTDDI